MLLDTSGLLCCFDADDSRHTVAVQKRPQRNARSAHADVSEKRSPADRLARAVGEVAEMIAVSRHSHFEVNVNK